MSPTKQTPNTTANAELVPDSNVDPCVPFFARRIGRPSLSLRSGIRAGLQESKVKLT